MLELTEYVRSRLWTGLCALIPLISGACEPATGDAHDVDPHEGYPTADRTDHTDVYFGDTVPDPYRWMEAMDAPGVRQWVEAQNALSVPYLSGIESRDAIKARLTELWDYERFGVPREAGGRLFQTRNDGLQDQDVLFVADDREAEPRVLIDPNGFSDDATVALAGWEVSPDGSHVAYARSDGGSDWRVWSVRSVEGGQDLEDRIENTKFTGIAWAPDSRGFYYSRYPTDADGQGDDQAAVSIHYHALGTPQSADVLVYGIPDHPTRNPYPTVTDDGRFLVISVQDGFAANGLYYTELGGDGTVVRLLDAWDARYRFLGNDGTTFYLHTNRDAPNWRVVAVDVTRPHAFRDVVAESEQVLETASIVGGRVFAEYLNDARSVVRVHGLDGEVEREVDLPGLGSAFGFSGTMDQPVTWYGFTSFTNPGAIYRYDIATGESTLRERATAGFDPDAYEARQVFVESTDGATVPMFLVHRADLDTARPQPTLLYGYGGFNVSLTPSFSVARLVWMERGGVLAVANLRGGGEYGEAWHQAGTKLQKQNVFDDFIAAAEWLIDEGVATPSTLAIQGGSNGGLLVGAVMIQRPDLFAAALPAVGVMDMLRYHTASLNARAWSSDYGLSENEDEYRALRAYSPVHTLEPETCYPPTLVTTADRDDRVVPWHSFKFAAAAQHAQGCANPILLRVETRAGHGAGKPTWMRIEEIADAWAFLDLHLDGEARMTDDAP